MLWLVGCFVLWRINPFQVILCWIKFQTIHFSTSRGGRSRDELISDVLLWTSTHGRAKAGRPARTYIQQLCEDMGCCPEDLPEAMNDREKWRERVRDIRATSTTWWWWRRGAYPLQTSSRCILQSQLTGQNVLWKKSLDQTFIVLLKDRGKLVKIDYEKQIIKQTFLIHWTQNPVCKTLPLGFCCLFSWSSKIYQLHLSREVKHCPPPPQQLSLIWY